MGGTRRGRHSLLIVAAAIATAGHRHIGCHRTDSLEVSVGGLDGMRREPYGHCHSEHEHEEAARESRPHDLSLTIHASARQGRQPFATHYDLVVANGPFEARLRSPDVINFLRAFAALTTALRL
jgi:hypothetical protein